jgi:hypothetical protein
VAPYEGRGGAAAARRLAQQQQQQARVAAAAASQAAAIQAEAERYAAADIEFQQLLDAEKPEPVSSYAPPASNPVQVYMDSMRAEIQTQLAQIRGDVGASLANLVPPVPAPEAPTGLSSVAAAEAAKAVDTIHEQMQGADNGE